MAMSDIKKLRAPYMFDIGGGDIGEEFDPYQMMGPPSTFERQPAEQAPIQDPRASAAQETAPQQGPPPKQMGVGTYGNIDPAQMAELVNKFYTPDTTSRDRFNTLLDQFPEQNKPGIMRKLVASGLSIKAQDPIATAEKVLHEPFLRDAAIWKEKAGPFQQAAQLENTANINERTLAGNVINAQTQSARIAEQERVANAKNETAMIRARAYQYSASLGKGWDWDLTGPTAKKLNKSTGEVIDTGLETGKMDEQTKIELQNEGRVQAARETGINAMNRTVVAGADYVQDAKGNLVKVNPRESGPPPTTQGPVTKIGTPKTGNTLEDIRAEQGRMQDLYEVDPTARKYITKDPNSGKYTLSKRPVVTAKGWPIFGKAEVTEDAVKEWDATKRSIDPTYVPPPEKPGLGPTTPPAGAQPKPQASTGLAPSPAVTAQKAPIDKVVTPLPKTATGEDRTRAAMRQAIGVAEADKAASRQTYLEGLLSNPSTPNQLKPAIQRELDDLKKNAVPPTPEGRIPVYDRNGRLVGHIPDTPEQRAAAAAQGYTTR